MATSTRTLYANTQPVLILDTFFMVFVWSCASREQLHRLQTRARIQGLSYATLILIVSVIKICHCATIRNASNLEIIRFMNFRVLNFLQFSSIFHWIFTLLLVCYNSKSQKFLRQFMDYFLRYPDIKQKKHKSKKVSCALDFLGFGWKVEQVFTRISSKN